jgi:hypothetical protein
MITNVSLVTLYVTDQDEARDFYVDKLGFAPHTDVRLGDGFRWVTIIHPDNPELEVTLMVPGPPLDEEMAQAVRRALANGNMGGFGLRTTDCHKDYEDLLSKGWSSPSRQRTGPTASRPSCGTTPETGSSSSNRSSTPPRTSPTEGFADPGSASPTASSWLRHG